MATILVAEDEPAILELMAATLAGEGHRVLAAADGLAAMALLAAEVPDLVLTDWMMPGLNGPELAARMRADPRWAAIPVVLVSAALRRAPSGLAEVTFLAKPFDIDRLLASVAAALRQGSDAD